MNKLLVSACLLGDPVRYDGKSKLLRHPDLARLVAAERIVAFCPEVAGGLPVPRPAAEIVAGDGNAVIDGQAQVRTRDGGDVSEAFLSGAQQALALCRRHGVRVAVLTESSPSCGSGNIYDGSFTRTAVTGSGVTAALLRRHGVAVYNQYQLDDALARLNSGADAKG
jgi:uncharacterized protein YbbK (DUF523 family)